MSSYTDNKKRLREIQETFNECIERAIVDEDYCNQFQLIIGIGREDEENPEKIKYNHAVFGSPKYLTPMFERIGSEPVAIVGLMLGIVKLKENLKKEDSGNGTLH